ncbi:hypothetical protein [Microvirga lotononidis]|uniref:Uncharacterized protein n=1 Tax=Microvirga lotononidis TaxID=864069 RepID=I4Z1S5_9HYPH|nr:hypothetical protein [Microvirga lotononidis]EIM30167.1 hypothetical protein MicloDRAFT_00014880 [Microvirga lotononidis]WQO31802.1 hypothetical protein U0023_31105 [Microvirga lotononidis]
MQITPLGPLEREAEGSSNTAIVTNLEPTAFGRVIFAGDHTLHADRPWALADKPPALIPISTFWRRSGRVRK